MPKDWPERDLDEWQGGASGAAEGMLPGSRLCVCVCECVCVNTCECGAVFVYFQGCVCVWNDD